MKRITNDGKEKTGHSIAKWKSVYQKANVDAGIDEETFRDKKKQHFNALLGRINKKDEEQ